MSAAASQGRRSSTDRANAPPELNAYIKGKVLKGEVNLLYCGACITLAMMRFLAVASSVHAPHQPWFAVVSVGAWSTITDLWSPAPPWVGCNPRDSSIVIQHYSRTSDCQLLTLCNDMG